MIAALMITDGRRPEYLRMALDAWSENLVGVDICYLYDGSGGSVEVFEAVPPEWVVYIPGNRGERTPPPGFAEAIREAWAFASDDRIDASHILHLEDDFIPTGPVDVTEMAAILDEYPRFSQVALMRQPWSPEEKAAGGIIETDPLAYWDVEGAVTPDFIEHRKFFTTNPCLIPRRIFAEKTWPEAPDSERKFSDELVRDGFGFCFLGRRNDPPRVLHIGAERVGEGY